MVCKHVDVIFFKILFSFIFPSCLPACFNFPSSLYFFTCGCRHGYRRGGVIVLYRWKSAAPTLRQRVVVLSSLLASLVLLLLKVLRTRAATLVVMPLGNSPPINGSPKQEAILESQKGKTTGKGR